MNLVIDIGNSLIKAAEFEKEQLSRREVFNKLEDFEHFLQSFVYENALVSSVSREAGKPEPSIKVSGRILWLDHNLGLPLKNRYENPEGLGPDRIAAACGAWQMFPHQDSLVIDAGTCINYEYVNRNGEYLGGAISPGVNIRFDAMHQYTSKLPQADPVPSPPLTGKNTMASLQSGVMNGALEEIKGVIQRYRNHSPDIRVILCGGDAHFFENDLKPSIFVAPNLVLMGLNSILLHNVNS